MDTNSQVNLYDSLSQQLRHCWLRVLGDEKRGVLTFPPNSLDDVAHTLFSNIVSGGFATYVVSSKRKLDPQNYYFEAARNASRRGCKITRAFLLPHKQYLKDEIVKEQWQLDTNAGIEVKVIYVGDLLSTLLVTPLFGLDFGLWDEQIVCASVPQSDGGEGLSEWRVSSREEDLELAFSLRDELLNKGTLLTYPNNESISLDLEEPMVQTAPLMDLLSSAVCSGSYMAEEDCSWYHGVWQYLRVFDLVSTPTWHPELYIPKLSQLAKNGKKSKILISGTADYSTLAHVLWAFDSKKQECEVTVVDLCQTPLIMCQWYGRKTNHKIKTVQSNILLFGENGYFDAVVTDAFLTRFNKVERSKIIKHWSELLSPGGQVITTIRIHGDNTSDKILAKPDQVDIFRSRALQQAKRWQDFLPLSPEELAVKAQRYAERMISNSVLSADEIRSEFEKNGFLIDYFTLKDVKGEMTPTTYLDLVAIKQ